MDRNRLIFQARAIVATAAWCIPILLLLAVTSAWLLSWFEPWFDAVLNPSMNWAVTFGYGVLMLAPGIAAAIRGKWHLAAGLFVCLAGYGYSVGITIEDPYYWGHVPKLYLILWAITLALSRFELAAVNFVIACVAYVMVDKFGANIGHGIASEWKTAHNILFIVCAALGAIAALLPTMPPNDAEPKQKQPRECVPLSQEPAKEEKRAA